VAVLRLADARGDLGVGTGVDDHGTGIRMDTAFPGSHPSGNSAAGRRARSPRRKSILVDRAGSVLELAGNSVTVGCRPWETLPLKDMPMAAPKFWLLSPVRLCGVRVGPWRASWSGVTSFFDGPLPARTWRARARTCANSGATCGTIQSAGLCWSVPRAHLCALGGCNSMKTW
jgi:hypothetical protein